MKCPTTGILQAYVDGELDIKTKKDVESHIQNCEDCNGSLNLLKSNDDFTFEKLTNYKNYYADITVQEEKHFHSDAETVKSSKEKKGMSYFMHKYNKIIAAACALVVLTTCITVQPARAVILDVLSIFRVDNMKGIRISPQDLVQMREALSNGQGDFNLKNIGRIKLSGGKTASSSFDQLKSTCGFPVLLPTGFTDVKPDIQTVEPISLAFTLDVNNVNKILKSFKASELFPNEIDGKTFTAKFGAQAQIKYSFDGKTYTLVQTTSPEIEVPDGVDADRLFNTMVNIPIFPEELKSKLKSISDWKHTLYVPVIDPMEEVSINGLTAYICSEEVKDESNPNKVISRIIWMNKGVIYGVISNTEKTDLLNFAQSLR